MLMMMMTTMMVMVMTPSDGNGDDDEENVNRLSVRSHGHLVLVPRLVVNGGAAARLRAPAPYFLWHMYIACAAQCAM